MSKMIDCGKTMNEEIKFIGKLSNDHTKGHNFHDDLYQSPFKSAIISLQSITLRYKTPCSKHSTAARKFLSMALLRTIFLRRFKK